MRVTGRGATLAASTLVWTLVAASAAAQTSTSPGFKRDMLGNLVPHVRAAAAIIYDPQTGSVLWEENMHDQRSIASLTKLMTAVTFLTDHPDLSQQVLVTRADTRGASVTYIRQGDRISHGDLLHLTLIASDNAAARVLARTSEGGTAAFIARMNALSTSLGLTNTQFADPSGLDARNVSSAYDVSQLVSYAASDERLSRIMRLPAYEAKTSRRVIKVRSTNRLLGTDVDIVGGKTGFIRKAGYCLATLVQIPQGPQVAVVVLGASSSSVRFAEARNLFKWLVARTQGLEGGSVPQQR